MPFANANGVKIIVTLNKSAGLVKAPAPINYHARTELFVSDKIVARSQLEGYLMYSIWGAGRPVLP